MRFSHYSFDHLSYYLCIGEKVRLQKMFYNMYAIIHTDGFTLLVYDIKEAFCLSMKAYKTELLAVWVNYIANS